jgi:FKBP-type peptidyl-prolyl cis-trans isomerase 2
VQIALSRVSIDSGPIGKTVLPIFAETTLYLMNVAAVSQSLKCFITNFLMDHGGRAHKNGNRFIAVFTSAGPLRFHQIVWELSIGCNKAVLLSTAQINQFAKEVKKLMARYDRKTTNTKQLLACLIALILSGCASQPAVVGLGDHVAIGFTCRTPNGDLAATTLTDGKVAAERKSALYLPQTGSETLEVTALQPVTEPYPDRQQFELEIVRRLAGRVAGMKEGEHALLELQADSYPKEGPKDGETRISRVLKRPMERRIAIDSYASRKLAVPEIGKKVMLDSNVPATVTEVTDKEVVMRAMVEPGHEYPTPFGPAVAKVTAAGYELAIDAKPGRLVRTGTMVGRIRAVEGDMMTMDYNHPFAGEKLACDVTIDRIIRKAPATEAPQEAKKPEEPANPGGGDQAAASADLMEKAMKFAESSNHEVSSASNNLGATLVAEAGDLAKVDYDAALDDGALIYTTRKAVAEDLSVRKSRWFKAPPAYGAETVAAGKDAFLPGVGEALAGMAVGEKKRLTLPPEKAFGLSDPQKLLKFPLGRTMPRTVTLAADEYVKLTGAFPTVGAEAPLTPYFPARVTAVREKEADLVFVVDDGASFTEPFGTMTIKADGKQITTRLAPVIGAPFQTPQGEGVISEADADLFTVDINHPLAGKTIVVDMELTGVTKAANLPKEPQWQEEHDAALAQAKKDGKPAVLVLYADWCGFCKKLFSETIPDPRIRAMGDRFTWIKINSDKLTDYKKQYGQNGFPMIVLFKADGSVARKLDGFQEPVALMAALQELL